jgi:sugar/nucleoside kinase (ribokinase family)
MNTRQIDIVVVGELNPDLVLSGDVTPEFGQVEKLVSQATLTIGSSSAIFACGAARLGLKVAFIGKVGSDIFGDFMCQSLAGYGIDTRGIIVDRETPTGISVILSKGEDRAILTYPGTIPLLIYADIDQNLLHEARHLHVASYFIQEGLKPDLSRLFEEAHQAGLTVSLDTNYDPGAKWEGVDKLLPVIDLFLPNEAEILGISGADCLDEAIARVSPKVGHLGIKLGAAGALYCHASQKYQAPAPSVDVVDTVGAGDSFDAGFIYGYLAGWQPARTLRLANVCGSLSTQQAGGTAGQPTLEAALRYL